MAMLKKRRKYCKDSSDYQNQSSYSKPVKSLLFDVSQSLSRDHVENCTKNQLIMRDILSYY